MTKSDKLQVPSPVYRAFISYSHRDKVQAQWLHRALEHYRFPAKLVGYETATGVVPKTLTPIFRDQDELPASGNLSTELQSALANSLFLIVICSPASAQSKWVNEEVRQFKKMHGADRVLALIVDGTPNAQPHEKMQECFAPALRFAVSTEGELTDTPSEPIAADIRKGADGKRLAKLKLISGLTGLRLDDLVQREASRRIRTMVQVSVASVLAAVFAVGLAVYANDRRIEANVQQMIAEQESATAKTVSEFLVNIFASATSIQQNPNDVTARSILDRGAQKIADELANQPTLQTRLSATIARAYNNLGLFDQAIELVDSATTHAGVDGASALSIKAEALLRKGQPDAAMTIASRAGELIEQDSVDDVSRGSAKVRADIASTQGQVYYQLGQHAPGLAAFTRALEAIESMPGQNRVEIARILQNRALLLSDTGEMVRARQDLERANTLVLASVGERDIMVGQIALAQAQVNFLSGKLEAAAGQVQTAIAVMQRILEDDNPALADAYSMQGQILHARGELKDAEYALTRSVELYTNAYGGRHYLSGIAEVYLGLIAGDNNDLQASLRHFDEAKRHYDASYGGIHANHGDLLVNRATVLASAGEIGPARKDCAQGMTILNETLGKQAAFTQQLQAVCDALVQN